MEMVGESVVSFVVERSLGLLLEEVKFLHGVSDQVEDIRAELRRMTSFLIDADRIQDESAMLRTKVEEVRDLSLKTEDVVETFVLKVASRRRGGSILSVIQRYACILNECIERHKVGSELQRIESTITKITRSLKTYELGEGSSSASQRKLPIMRRTYSHTDEEEFVGMHENVKELVTQLVEKNKNCRVVSISGMGGIGKTTLARKVYKDIRVQRHFDGCAWACISDQFQQQQTKDVLCGILSRLTGEKSEELKKMNDDELVKRLFEVQKNKKCLVVLDDIWSSYAWGCLKDAFPMKETYSKILLTTRKKEVVESVKSVDPRCFHLEQRYLTDDESWELLQKKAFTEEHRSDPGEEKSMEQLGKKMVGHCGGLPLAVVVLGGLLGTKHTLREWEMVDQNINFYLNRGNKIGQQHGSVPQVLALSYSDLPYQLKPCFLCLGNFPEDSDIEVDKLYKVWMAEGMVLADDKADKETLTDVAERYLGELAARFMVELQIDLTGRIFSCRLHDMMRELCLSKGKEENFLKFIDIRSDGAVKEDIVDSSSSSSSSSSISKVRRLSVYLDVNVEGFVPPEQGTSSTQHLRSLMFFTPAQYGRAKYIPKVLIKSYFRDFKFLRVLILENFRGSSDELSLPNGIGSLIHLRYLSVRDSWFNKLPSSLDNLAYLQTLDLRVFAMKVACLPNVLWKMRRLMHLYLPLFFAETLIKKLKLDGLSNLETLENFNPSVCCAKDLFKLTNLRKLKLKITSECKLEELEIIIKYLNDDVTSSNRLLRHSCVSIDCGEEQLGPEKWVAASTQLLVCHHLHELSLINRCIDKLPSIFSPSITKLTLFETMLDEDFMETLEKLPRLLILRLISGSFMGKEMVCSAMGFPRLKSLTLYKLRNLENWRVDEGAMPCLTHLTIQECENLKMVPDGLRFVTTLKELKLLDMPEAFIDRVGVLQEKDGKEGEDFDKVRHVPYITFTCS